MGAIRHVMQSSGIEDILVEADVYHPGTANKIMSGKDYYAMLHAHSLVLAAMLEMHWEAFERWLISEPDGSELDWMALFAEQIQNLAGSVG